MRGSAILAQEHPTYLNKIVIAHVDLYVASLKDINVIFKQRVSVLKRGFI